MSELKPIKKWAYPVKLIGTSADFEPAMYFEGLAKALGGTYPLGRNGLLHPAIHFDFGTAAYIDPKGVYAIADGQVVAYRMDAAPLEIRYDGDANVVKYSSSFVLIKHKFQLPPKPAAPTPATPASTPATPVPATPAATAAPECITLYSVYMHLLDATAYNDTVSPLAKPPYIPIKYTVKSSVTETVAGLRIRGTPSGQPVLGVLANLSKIEVGAEFIITPQQVVRGRSVPAKTNPKWKKYLSVTGILIPAVPMPEGKSPATDGYVFKDSLTGGQVTNCNDTESTFGGTKVTYVYSKLVSGHRKIIANLPAGAVVVLGAQSSDPDKFYELKSVENMQDFPVPPIANGIMGYVDYSHFDAMPFPTSGAVTLVSPPIDIKAGALIGHPGHFQNHNNVTQQIQLHLECFTPDDLPGFIAKGKAWAQDLNVHAADKTLLKVAKGSKLIAAVVDAAGKLVVPVVASPKLTDAGTALHSDIILPLSALNALPANQKLSLPESAAVNAKKLRWWFLNNVGGQADGTKIKGWLCEKNATAISPWEWQGFTTLEDSTEDEKLIAYQLKLGNKLLPAEEGTYSGITDAGKNWPLMKQLIKTITDNKVDGLTLAGTLTAAQLTDAGKGYWCAQKIASITPKITTEWKKDEARWNKLDTLMGHHADSENLNWVIEKERIKQLSFWDEVSGITGAADGKVWFLNPMWLSASMQKVICTCDEDFLFGIYKYGSAYGPGYTGTTALEDYAGWQKLLNATGTNKITELEKSILCAMSPNEGNMEAIQSYDSEILTAGCMQKTVSPEGKGQFSTQVSKFKTVNPKLYDELFEACGWIVSGSGVNAELRYRDPALEGAPLLAGAALKQLIRTGFNQVAHDAKSRVPCKSLACLIPAIGHPEFLELQVMDFAQDLRDTLKITATGYNFTVGDYFKSAFGQAIALDHHVNRPGHVGFYLGKSLDKFFETHTTLSNTTLNWGTNHDTYEKEVLAIYGPLRGTALKDSPMTAATARYTKIKDHFN